MKKRNRFFTTFACVLAIVSLLSVLLLTAGRGQQTPEEQARQILDATGIKGGLVVHVGCRDGKLTAALRANDSYLVHGLDRDAKNIEQARKHIHSLNLYGKVTAEQFAGDRLPYIDNLVNLIVSENLGKVSMAEVMRVLCPNGVAYIKNDETWTKTVKPWPNNIDEWTHFLHDASNNAVAHDSVVGPPRYIQWVGKPKFARAHEQLASISAVVSAGGRFFYIIDEGPRADIRLPSEWYLVARDAFNGVELWRRPLSAWADQHRRFRSGPPDLALRLVAGDERVYVTLGIDAAVSVLDAATGDTRWVYKGTESTRQIVCVGDKLVMLVDTQPQTTSQIESEIRRGLKPAPGVRAIVTADASSDKILWRKEIKSFVHPTLAAQKYRLFYQMKDTLFCLDMDTGDELWHAPVQMELKGHEVGWESPTLVVENEVVYSADFKQMIAFSVEDGRQLWAGSCWPGYNSPPDVLVIDGLVWTKGRQVQRNGLDPVTGTLRKEILAVKGYMHHRCYRNKATDRFILLGNQGVQFIDVKSGEIWQNYWIRGTCQYGIMPANGLLYIPPHSCACNLKTKLNGFYALAADRESVPKSEKEVRFEKGPAYAAVDAESSKGDGDWPTYRHDAMRSGMTKARVVGQLKQVWQADIGGQLSSVVAADGKVLVASIDTHTVYALNGEDGSKLWSYTAGGRVDSPPTVYKGIVLFGSADGWVYALRGSDGKLMWRFRAAPEDRRVFVNGQLESVWPVHGSVLVKDDVLTVAAGRSSYLDGGIYVYRLEPQTGKKISQTVIYSPDPETGKQPPEGGKEMRGVLTDILSTDGEGIYMRHMKVDFETGSETGTGMHLFTPIGFLDDSWWHRAYWVVNDEFLSHWSGWWKVGNAVPSGRILCYNESSVFGYGRDKYSGGNTGQWRGGEKYQLFAYDRDSGEKDERRTEKQASAKNRKKKEQTSTLSTLNYRWTTQVPLFVQAMVVADKTMFTAGPPDIIRTEGPLGETALELENPQEALDAWKGKKGGILWAVSCEDGEKLAEYKLDSPPVFDGMIASNGRLYISTRAGRVVCMSENK